MSVSVSWADLTGMGEWLVGVIWQLAGLQTGIFTEVELCYGLGNHFKPSSANSVWTIPNMIVNSSWSLIWIIWGHELDLKILFYPHNILHIVDQYRHMKGIYFSIRKKQNVLNLAIFMKQVETFRKVTSVDFHGHDKIEDTTCVSENCPWSFLVWSSLLSEVWACGRVY